MENNNESYNYFLFKIRENNNLSRKQFARQLGIKPLRYSFIERGYIKPSKKEVINISKSLEIDYSLYLNGINSYPKGLDEKDKSKLVKGLFAFISSLTFRIINGFLILLSIALIIICFSLSNKYTKNSRDYMDEKYLSVFDKIREVGTPTFSFTSSKITRPEIFFSDNNKHISIISSYSSTDVLNVKYIYSKINDNSKTTITANMNGSISNDFKLHISYTNLIDYNTYSTVYYFDDNKFVNDESSTYSTLEEADNQLASLFIDNSVNEFSLEMESLIKDKLDIEVDFNNDLIINVIDNKTKLTRNIVFSFVGGLSSICLTLALVFLLIYSFLYGNDEYDIKIFRNSTTYSDQTIDLYSKRNVIKTDIKIFPIIPESFLKILGIILACAGSIRILLLFLKFLGFLPDSQVVHNLDYSLDIYFGVGLFLIFFVNFDIFKDDRRSIRNIFLYFLVFLGLYILEVIIIYTIRNFAVGRLFFDNSNATLPNYFGTICCYFLIMLFLFNNPKWANTKGRLYFFRSLSLVPILIIISTTYINYASKINNWDLPIYVQYLFNSGRPQISMLCISYLIGLYFLRLNYKLKYGTEACKTLFNGNRYLFQKNILMTSIVIIISLFELLLLKNNIAHKYDLGLYPHIIILAPFMMLYHPHVGGRNRIADNLVLGIYILFYGLGYFIIGLLSLAFLL